MIRYHKGIGLVEILVSMIVIAIILVIAIPKYLSYDRNKKIDASLSRFSADVSFAQTKARALNERVILCPRATVDGVSCGKPSDWSHGWLIVSGPTPTVLYANAPTDSVVSLSSSKSTVTFLPNGTTQGGANFTLSVLRCSEEYVYTININRNGVLSTSRSECT